MGDNSAIEWTDATWNPVVGCSEVSPGCGHCYARTMAKRLRAMALADIAAGKDPGRKRHYVDAVDQRGRWTGKLIPVPESLGDPLRWRRPRRVFVNSMSDLFHESLPFEFIDQVFAVMALAGQHTFQVLTKRPERMAQYCNRPEITNVLYAAMEAVAEANDIADFLYGDEWPLPNVWLGTSCEDQQRADERIPQLLKCPAAVRFLSIEPLLGPIDLRNIQRSFADGAHFGDALTGVDFTQTPPLHSMASPSIDWVIVGGESGAKARPMHPDWARAIRDQCQAAGVPFLFKQWGEWGAVHQPVGGAADDAINSSNCRYGEWHDADGPFIESCLCGAGHGTVVRVGKHAAGRLLDGREWNQYPQPQEATR